MCGITGYIISGDEPADIRQRLVSATECMASRGPDSSGTYFDKHIGFGHRRLSIIDLSADGNQPMYDEDEEFVITFNGEIYNYKELRKELVSAGVEFRSQSDTEVLLKLFRKEGSSCFSKLNGFFSFAIYNKRLKEIYIVRDRIGIKPLYYFKREDAVLFGSELKTLVLMGVPKVIDNASLCAYLQLNYIPAPHSIVRDVRKLEPGTFLKLVVKHASVSCEQTTYYSINKKPATTTDKGQINKRMFELLEEAVCRRLVSDVPLGSFLSGGIDSSIIAALASRHIDRLNTYSIGFSDDPAFDETSYAQLVADKIGSKHHVFKLSNDDLFGDLHHVLDYMSEPFADSSALAVYILSRHVKKHVSVALSGDGADELFAGYNKHKAHYEINQGGLSSSLVRIGSPLWQIAPKSRQSKSGNLFRQLDRFSKGAKLSAPERYWRWCSFISTDEAYLMLKNLDEDDHNRFLELMRLKTSSVAGREIDDVLMADCKMVLPDDMLTKVDLMSMAHSLEVRVPFLDHNVVDFAFTLPEKYKIDKNGQKNILRSAFGKLLPAELLHRKKQGFEVPLLNWFQTDLKQFITDDVLSEKFISDQGIFNPEEISRLKKKLYSNDPGEVVARIWGLIVFQNWWKQYMQ